MSKISKACDISPAVRTAIHSRDGGRCIICGSFNNIQIAHYIPRSRLGLGIPQNLADMCAQCHFQYDNGKQHNQIKKAFKDYLKAYYPEWDETKLTYRKWEF